MNITENFWLYIAIATVSAVSFVIMFHLSSQLK